VLKELGWVSEIAREHRQRESEKHSVTLLKAQLVRGGTASEFKPIVIDQRGFLRCMQLSRSSDRRFTSRRKILLSFPKVKRSARDHPGALADIDPSFLWIMITALFQFCCIAVSRNPGR
jgi:hypothetical protein